MYTSGSYVFLADVLKLAAAKFPDNAKVADHRIRVLMEANRFQEAYSACVESFSERADADGFARYACLCSQALGRPYAAREWALRRLLLDPGLADAWRDFVALRKGEKRSANYDKPLDWILVLDPADRITSSYWCYRLYKSGVAHFFTEMERLVRRSKEPFWFRYFRALVAELHSKGEWAHADAAYLGSTGDSSAIATHRFLAGLDRTRLAVFADKQEVFVHGLAHASARIGNHGLVMEFGVADGASARLLAAMTPCLHAFDTFNGLPARWGTQDIGAYTNCGRIPDLPAHVEIHVGLFHDTIPVFKAANAGPAKFVNVDCDLYASTVDVLNGLADRFIDGTVIVFDEFFGYQGFEQHEMKAFNEFITKTGWSWHPIAIAPFCKQLAVQLHKA